MLGKAAGNTESHGSITLHSNLIHPIAYGKKGKALVTIRPIIGFVLFKFYSVLL